MPKKDLNRSTIINLCKALSDIHGSNAPIEEGLLKNSVRSLETIIHNLLSQQHNYDDHLFGALISTGSESLRVEMLQKATQPISIHPRQWRQILKANTPKAIAPLIGPKIAYNGAIYPLLGAIAAGDRRWVDLVLSLAELPHNSDTSILNKRNAGLLANPKVADIVAAYIRKHVKVSEGRYLEIVKNFLAKEDYYIPAVLHAAGLDVSIANRESIIMAKSTRHFFAMLESNHRKLAWSSKTQSLEELLGARKEFEDWAERALAM